jgi:methyl-accepting chemotaxis protein
MHEQLTNAGQIAQGLESVHRTVEEADRALREQSESCRRIAEFLKEMKRDTQSNEDSARAMALATEGLREQANLLRRKVQRFRI